ncbi:MAG: hypothetical protein FJ382_05540 [Verrucomicrobia bacterium]|nr:hypothetical protein [Verrucomicrobiota bacterium]
MADRPRSPDTEVAAPSRRRRRLRLVVAVAVSVLAFAAGLAGLALTPAVQTFVAQRVLTARPELGLTVGRLDVGLSHSTVTQLTLQRGGLRVTAPRMEVEGSLISALLGRIALRRLAAEGWVVEWGVAPAAPLPVTASVPRARAGWVLAATTVAPDPSGPSSAGEPGSIGAGGLLDAWRLPEGVSIDQLSLRGEVRGSLAAGERGTLTIEVKGGSLRAGAEALLDLTASGSRGSGVDRVSWASRVGLRIGADSRLEAVQSDGTLSVQATGFPTGDAVAVVGGIERLTGSASGERYSLVVRRAGAPWLEMRAGRAAPTAPLRGTLTLELNDRDVSPALPGRALPEFALRLDTTFSAASDLSAVEVTGKAGVETAHWERLFPELGALGPVRLAADFGLAREGDRIRVFALRTEAAERAPLFGLELRQPFVWNPASGEVEAADPTKDLVAFRLRGLPLAVFQPMLPPLRIEGGDATGAWSLRVSPGGIAVRNTEPLAIARFSLLRPEGVAFRDVQLEVRPSADLTPRGWQAELADAVVRGGGAVLARGSGRAGRAAGESQALKLTGTLDLDLPGVLAQPLLAAADRLKAGKVQLTGSATVGEVRQAALDLKASGLVEASGAALPDASVELRIDQAANGGLTLRMPVRLEASGRVTDLVVAGQASAGTGGWTVDGQITGKRVFVSDLRLLAVPWAAGSAPASGPAAQPGPSGPAWQGVSGKVAFALGEVISSPELVAREVRGTVSIEQVAVVVETLQAILATGGNVEGSGKVSYAPPGAGVAYVLDGTVAARDVEAGPALQAVLPAGGTPAVEGRFDLRSRLVGGAESLGELVGGIRGDLQMVSRGGVLRPLPASYVAAVASAKDQLQRRSDQAGALGALADAIGARLPSALGGAAARTQQFAVRLGELEAVLRLLGEIRFDQLTLDAGVASDWSTALRDLTITSPELRFVGQGALQAAPGAPFWQRPLTLQLTGAARGRSADALRRINLLSRGSDALGYVPFSLDVALEGTPDALDASKLIAAVADRVLGVSLSAEDVRRLRAGDPAVLLALATALK